MIEIESEARMPKQAHAIVEQGFPSLLRPELVLAIPELCPAIID